MYYTICTINSTLLKRLHILIFLGLPTFATSIKTHLIDLGPREAFQQTPKKIKESSGSKKTLSYYVEFENGKSNLNLLVKEKLNRVYSAYVVNATDTVNILTETTVDKLFKERSINITNYLISKGLPSNHIRSIDYGKRTGSDGIDLIVK